MNFDFDPDNMENFHVNYEKVLNMSEFLPVTRLLAADMMKSQYKSIGDFLKSLSDNSLKELSEISQDENDERFEQIVLIAEMLSAAEGTNISGMSNFHKRTNMFITILVFESLHRKKLVKLHHENITFGEDMADKIVVEKI
mgnify:FL=1